MERRPQTGEAAAHDDDGGLLTFRHGLGISAAGAALAAQTLSGMDMLAVPKLWLSLVSAFDREPAAVAVEHR